MPAPEAHSRQKIDELLIAADWLQQDYKALNLGAGKGIALREVPLDSGRCDYLHNRQFTRAASITTNIAHLTAERSVEIEFSHALVAKQTRVGANVWRRLSSVEELEAIVQAISRPRSASASDYEERARHSVDIF